MILWVIVARYFDYSSNVKNVNFNVKFPNFEKLRDTNDINLLDESDLLASGFANLE